MNGAVRGVLKRALQVDGVIRGLHEAEPVHSDLVQVYYCKCFFCFSVEKSILVHQAMFCYFESGGHVVDLDGIRMNSHEFAHVFISIFAWCFVCGSMISTERESELRGSDVLIPDFRPGGQAH